MVLIGLGANLPSGAGSPRETLEAAIAGLAEAGMVVTARSCWYRSAPVPRSDQPDYVNGVVRVRSDLAPARLLAALHAIERRYGRERGIPNAARSLDLDLLDHCGRISGTAGSPLLPHPRLHLRGFVLLPLAEVAPDWRHPVSRRRVRDLIADLPRPLGAEPLPE